MPPVKGKMWAYSVQQMEAAMSDVARGMPVSTAAKHHNVPRVTLLYKVRGKTPAYRRMGPESVLKQTEEEILVHWIKSVAKAGFPVTTNQVLDSVEHLVKELKRTNNFRNGRPGRKWLMGFIKRNPSIANRVAENLTSSRASVTKEKILAWYNEVYTYLKENEMENVLENPMRVFNGDETAFFLNPKGNKVLAAKGQKSVYLQVNSDDKECLTVLITASAAGILAPPLVVFKYERIPIYLAESVPREWGIGKSDSGWMTCALFFEYMANVFYPWLVETKITLPVLFFLDGHTSHMSLHLSKFCNEKGIILVALPPNATHLIQPMDVAVFRSLKESWKTRVHEWRIKNMNDPILRKKDFSGLLKQVLDEKITHNIVHNGFRKCGLVPWNPNAITFDDHPENLDISTKSTIQSDTRMLRNCLTVLEKFIDKEKLESFQDSETWTGCVEDTSLYYVWQNIRTEIRSSENSLNLDKNIEKSVVHYTQNGPPTIPIELGETNNNSRNDNVVVIQEEPRVIAAHNNNNSISNAVPTSPTNNTSISSLLPSPFKKSLIWPEENQKRKNKKRKTEIIPCVISSDSYQQYQEKKKKKKLEAEDKKKERALARLKKKEEQEIMKQEKAKQKAAKTQQKRKKKVKNIPSSSEEEEEWVPSDNSIDDISLLGDISSIEEELNLGLGLDLCRPISVDTVYSTVGLNKELITCNEYQSNVFTIDLADKEQVRDSEIEVIYEEENNDISVNCENQVTGIKTNEEPAIEEELESLTVTKENVYKSELLRPYTNELPCKKADEYRESHNFQEGYINQSKGKINSESIKVDDFVIVSILGKKKMLRHACKIEDIIMDGNEATVFQLVPCNRLKNVFSIDKQKRLKIYINQIISKLPSPLVLGTDNKRVQFPISIAID